MKNIVNTIIKDNKNTFEGFFDNIGASPFKALDEFLNKNKDRVVTLKGKDYLVYDFQLFDVDEMRDVIKKYIDPKYEGNQDIAGGGYRIFVNFNFADRQSGFKNDKERGKGLILGLTNIYTAGNRLSNGRNNEYTCYPFITYNNKQFYRGNREKLLRAGAITAEHITREANDKFIADFYKRVLR